MSATGALPLTHALSTRRRDWTSPLAVVLACLIFAGLSTYLAYTSDSDLEADATTHFLFARYALLKYHYFASVWGRPLCTAAYALASRIGTVEEGRRWARLTSLVLAIIVAATTYAIGKRQGIRRPALIVIFVLAQPLFFLHSFSELTEIPFAVVLMLAFLAYQRRRFFLMACCTALLPLGRPEGFGFIMMAIAALLAHRRWWPLLVLPIPFLIWNFAGWVLTTVIPPGWPWWRYLFNHDWYRWVARNWPYSYHSVYGSGPIWQFVAELPVLVSPFVFPFMLIGTGLGFAWLWPRRVAIARAADDRGGSVLEYAQPSLTPRPGPIRWFFSLTHEQRCEIWIVSIPLSILIVHSILWWKGLMGSNGSLRYLIIIGPFYALSASRGWEWAWARFRWRMPLFCAGVAALLPIGANFAHGQRVVPLPLYEDGYVAREVARWYEADAKLRVDFPKIMPTNPGIPFYMDIDLNDTARAVAAGRFTVENPPPGALLVWDPIYGPSNSSADMCTTKEMIERSGWIHYKHFEYFDRYGEVYLSPKTIKGEDTHKYYKGDWESNFDGNFKFPQ